MTWCVGLSLGDVGRVQFRRVSLAPHSQLLLHHLRILPFLLLQLLLFLLVLLLLRGLWGVGVNPVSHTHTNIAQDECLKNV